MMNLTPRGAGTVLLLALALTGSQMTIARTGVAHAAPSSAASNAAPPAGQPTVPGSDGNPLASGCTTTQVSRPKSAAGKAVKKYLGRIKKYIPAYESKLHHAMNVPVCLNYPQHFSGDDDDYAHAGIYDAQGKKTGATIAACWIEINPVGFPKAKQPIDNTLAHELFHCFQGVVAGMQGFWHRHYKSWVLEGQAEWAAAIVAGPDPNDDPGWWTEYLKNPNVPLFEIPKANGYRAIGFYSHLDESGIDPWKVIPEMVKASGDADAFRAGVYGAGEGAAKDFFDSWASGLFRNRSRGKAWDTTGPGIPNGVRPSSQTLSVSAGSSVTKEAKPYTESLYTLSPTAEIVTVSGQGYVRMSDGAMDSLVSEPVNYCVKASGCACPEGKTYQGPPLVPLNAGATAIGVTGGESGSSVTAAGQSLDDLCTKRDACLVGNWQVTDESAFVASTSGGVFVLTGMSGSETMTFTKKGKITVAADNFTIDVAEPSGGASISLGVTDGTTTADWDTPTKGDLEFSNIDVGDYRVTIDGEVVSTGLFGGDTSSMNYTCSGNTLNLYLISSDPSIDPIVLTRQGS